MRKVVHPCDVKDQNGRHYPMFCEIEIEDGRLSITGVIGPTKGGNAHGGAGQIDMEFAHRDPKYNDPRTHHPVAPDELRFSKDWDENKWYTFLDIWHDWHLNDMRPGCEHQVGEEWTGRDVKLYHFVLAPEVVKIKRAAEDAALAALVRRETFVPTEEQSKFAALPFSVTLPVPEAPQYYNPREKTSYSPSVEVKNTSWLRESEHPDGFLCKPCPVCGYEYGTSWRRVELPIEVIEFLESLPKTDRIPNWI